MQAQSQTTLEHNNRMIYSICMDCMTEYVWCYDMDCSDCALLVLDQGADDTDVKGDTTDTDDTPMTPTGAVA